MAITATVAGQRPCHFAGVKNIAMYQVPWTYDVPAGGWDGSGAFKEGFIQPRNLRARLFGTGQPVRNFVSDIYTPLTRTRFQFQYPGDTGGTNTGFDTVQYGFGFLNYFRQSDALSTGPLRRYAYPVTLDGATHTMPNFIMGPTALFGVAGTAPNFSVGVSAGFAWLSMLRLPGSTEYEPCYCTTYQIDALPPKLGLMVHPARRPAFAYSLPVNLAANNCMFTTVGPLVTTSSPGVPPVFLAHDNTSSSLRIMTWDYDPVTDQFSGSNTELLIDDATLDAQMKAQDTTSVTANSRGFLIHIGAFNGLRGLFWLERDGLTITQINLLPTNVNGQAVSPTSGGTFAIDEFGVIYYQPSSQANIVYTTFGATVGQIPLAKFSPPLALPCIPCSPLDFHPHG